MKQALIHFSLIALVLCGGVRLRADTIDQSYLGPPAPQVGGGPISQAPNGLDIAQTFTVGLAGELSRVEVLAVNLGAVDPLQVEIRSTTNGVPDSSAGSILASGFISASDIGGGLSDLFVDMSSSHLAMTPGEILAIVLQSSDAANGYMWAADPGSPYLRGDGFFRSSTSDTSFNLGEADQYFATYVDAAPVPEPGSGALLTIGLTLGALLFDERLRRIFTRAM